MFFCFLTSSPFSHSTILRFQRAPKTAQDCSKTVPRRSSRGTFSTLKSMMDLGPFWDRFWLPFGTNFGHAKGSKNHQSYEFGAKGPQEAPKRHPKRPQEASRRPPRGPQEAPRGLQEAPKRAQDGPKKAKEGVERAQEASQEGPGGRMSWYLPVATY